MDLSCLSLNIWGLPFGISKDKSLRITAIAEALYSTSYDVICLQEVWTKNDYRIFKSHLKDSHPFHHYFHSGLIGSGLCIFSKLPIEETFYYQFPMNGWFHMIHHGDWFGGKGVGLAILNHNGIKISVYNTHLHANYSSPNVKDHYQVHRLVQCFDTALFIKHTSCGSDLSIFAGDLNCTPEDLGIKILKDLTNLEDTVDVGDHKEPNLETNNSKRNMYREKGLSDDFEGFRIDYIFFKCNESLKVTISEVIFPFEETIPNTHISYSDHEAIAAKLHCKLSGGHNGNITELKRKENVKSDLKVAFDLCRDEISSLKNHIQMIFSCILFLVSIMLALPLITHETLIIKVVLFPIVSIICLAIALIVARWHEIAWLKNTKKRLKIYIRNLACVDHNAGGDNFKSIS